MSKALPPKPNSVPKVGGYWVHVTTREYYEVVDHVFDATNDVWCVEYQHAGEDDGQTFTRSMENFAQRFLFVAYGSAAFRTFLDKRAQEPVTGSAFLSAMSEQQDIAVVQEQLVRVTQERDEARRHLHAARADARTLARRINVLRGVVNAKIDRVAGLLDIYK
jgi:hypothetical protein